MINKRIAWIFCLSLMAQQAALADMEVAKQALDAGDYVTAEREFRIHADQGEANAQYILGRLYEKGNGLIKDEAWAITWYRKAADQGHALARDTLNRIYSEAGIPSPYLEQAKKAEAAQLVVQPEPQVIHNPQAQTATLTDKGQQFERLRLMAAAMDAQTSGDLKTAAANYQKLAEAGDAGAQMRLAGMYRHGEGVVEQDAGKAAHWYLQAAEQGNAGGQYQIAKMYQNGEGVEKNSDEAFSWYRAAASQGHEAANREFDLLVEAAEEKRLAADAVPAAEAVAEAAAEEVKEKPVSRGFFATLFGASDQPEEQKQEAVENEAVVEQIAKAEPLAEALKEEEQQSTPLNQPIPLNEANELPYPLPLEKSPNVEEVASKQTPEKTPLVDTGASTRAQELQDEAVRYQTGDGVKKDLAKAASLYQQSAQQGNAEAQFNLGNMYLLGEGVVQDDAWAVTWYRKAAAQGHTEAKRNLDNLYQAAGIDPKDQIENAVVATKPVVEPAATASSETVVEKAVETQSVEATVEPVSLAAAEAESAPAAEKKGFFSRLFGSNDAQESQQASAEPAVADPVEKPVEPVKAASIQVAEAPAAESDEVAAEPISISAGETPADSAPAKKGFFGSLFGGSDEKQSNTSDVQTVAVEQKVVVAEPVDVAPAVATTAVASTEVVTETAEATTETAGGVGGFFSSLFGGGKESEPEPEQVQTITPAEAEKAVTDTTTQTANVEQDNRTKAALDRLESDIVSGVSTKATTRPAAAPKPDVTVAQATDALKRNDYTTALRIFRELSDQGDADAQAHLGYMYFIGEGVAKDSKEAIYWLSESSKQGNADAQYNLAVAYAFGDGVEQDYTQAVYWYRKSAEQGHLKAQYSLAISYTRGEGVAADLVEAVRWYRSAAQGGDAEAQYYLGYLLQVGAGVEMDRDEALKWFRRAADQGHAAAEEQAANMMSDKGTY